MAKEFIHIEREFFFETPEEAMAWISKKLLKKGWRITSGFKHIDHCLNIGGSIGLIKTSLDRESYKKKNKVCEYCFNTEKDILIHRPSVTFSHVIKNVNYKPRISKAK